MPDDRQSCAPCPQPSPTQPSPTECGKLRTRTPSVKVINCKTALQTCTKKQERKIDIVFLLKTTLGQKCYTIEKAETVGTDREGGGFGLRTVIPNLRPHVDPF